MSAKRIEEMARYEEETLTPDQAAEAEGGFSWGATQLGSFSWGETQLGTASHGTGAGAGKVSMQDFHFVMR